MGFLALVVLFLYIIRYFLLQKQFGNMSRGILKRFLDKRVTLTNLCTP